MAKIDCTQETPGDCGSSSAMLIRLCPMWFPASQGPTHASPEPNENLRTSWGRVVVRILASWHDRLLQWGVEPGMRIFRSSKHIARPLRTIAWVAPTLRKAETQPISATELIRSPSLTQRGSVTDQIAL